ncbi:hypothetical protein OAM52_01970 [Flavobacteriaceae bacterium]|nr:hypothetical protein [Flavobacteriaceae bacterium]
MITKQLHTKGAQGIDLSQHTDSFQGSCACVDCDNADAETSSA